MAASGWIPWGMQYNIIKNVPVSIELPAHFVIMHLHPYFGADDDIILLDTLQQFAQAPFVDLFRSACCLADPFVDLQTVVAAEPLYFKSLVLDRLTVSTDSDIPVNHKTLLC